MWSLAYEYAFVIYETLLPFLYDGLKHFIACIYHHVVRIAKLGQENEKCLFGHMPT